MPKGSGHSIEQQVTGEDKVGGVQFICFAPKPEKFSPVPPRPVVLPSTLPLQETIGGEALDGLPAELTKAALIQECDFKTDSFKPAMASFSDYECEAAPQQFQKQSCAVMSPQFCCAPPPAPAGAVPYVGACAPPPPTSAPPNGGLAFSAPPPPSACFAPPPPPPALTGSSSSYCEDAPVDSFASFSAPEVEKECFAEEGEEPTNAPVDMDSRELEQAVVADMSQKTPAPAPVVEKKKEVTEMTISAGFFPLFFYFIFYFLFFKNSYFFYCSTFF